MAVGPVARQTPGGDNVVQESTQARTLRICCVEIMLSLGRIEVFVGQWPECNTDADRIVLQTAIDFQWARLYTYAGAGIPINMRKWN